jgi:protein phosphatase
MKILSAGGTDPGKKRANNEDSFLLDDRLGLYAVADGIGGHEGGEIASRMAMETFTEVLPDLLTGEHLTPPFSLTQDVDPKLSALRYSITLSNQKIVNAAAQNPSLTGMGTTITSLLLSRDTAYLAHVGDSRAYLFRSGTLKQITADHSYVAEQIKAGRLTPEQARTNPYRHVITRAVGIDREVAVDHATLALQKNDTFLLCTDGLTELVENGDIAAVLARTTPQAVVEELIRLANERGGVDNITVVVVTIVEL